VCIRGIWCIIVSIIVIHTLLLCLLSLASGILGDILRVARSVYVICVYVCMCVGK
jgi:hypothetical protein